jgi:glutamate synthase (NADPH/NADH) small chain
MGELKGFLKYKRQEAGHRPVESRIHDFHELLLPLTPDQIRQQAARCMDCGIPFCHGEGCPLGNSIPDLNDFLYKGQWERACRLLHTTNNFPEITGRVCPAPCEAACTLSINDEPILIRHIECQIVERGFQEGWIRPEQPEKKTGKRVAIIGSGPAGLAAAQQLARAGHAVTVFERDSRPGGMLRYGIPDFKLEKWVLDRRIEQLTAEGVEFQTDVKAGDDISARYLLKMFDCILLAMGARQPRDLVVPGRGYDNIVFAMDYLTAQNKLNSGELDETSVTTKDRVVAVIGGGDTGSDCVGTARRQGASKIYQLEILPEPPETRPPDTPWPMWPRIMRTSTSHEEGCKGPRFAGIQRMWAVMTKKFSGLETRVGEIHCCKVEWEKKDNQWKIKELAGTDFVLKVDLVILATGFVHVEHEGLVKSLGLQTDQIGNILVVSLSNPLVTDYQTPLSSVEDRKGGVFSCGDAVSGPSLVVRAIDSGRKAAAAINRWFESKDRL